MSQTATAEQSPSLTRQFALFAGFVVVAAGVLLMALYKEIAADDLNDMAERSNSAVARVFSNVVWDSHAGFLTTAHFLTADAIRAHPETLAIRESVLTKMRNLSILKIKIYDLNGLTVFSTDPQQIGEDKSGYEGFLAARIGSAASELTYRERFNAFEQMVENRDVLSSYVPITSASGAIEGVLEVYYDVTGLLTAVRQRQYILEAVVGGTFLLLYLLLILTVWRSEKRSHRHHRQSLELARAAARAEEANRMKSEFLATMSHELRTPLNAILGFSEILKAQLPSVKGEATTREYADSIWSSGRLLLNIVDDVLDMSKVESGALELKTAVFNPQELVRACIKQVEHQALAEGVSLDTEVADGLPVAFGDERRIKQVLLNLLSNGIKFTPAGGRVCLSVTGNDGGELVFTTSDTGIGIEAADIEKVLSPFGQVESSYARRFGGTGLGLTIAKSLVEMHGGCLSLESQPGKGTTVSFNLPAPEREADIAPLAMPA